MPVKLTDVSFSGHETFPFRWRWLKKGVDAVAADPDAFSREDAMVRLGVGKNMVRSIRHWCLATGMLDDGARSNRGRGALAVSKVGHDLLDDSGWDPYLDDVASLWLLHWLVVSNPARATTWYLSFTVLNEPEFSKERLVDFVETHARETTARATRPSITRDVDCFLRTYVSSLRTASGLLEEGLECPLTELGLIQQIGSSGVFRFAIGPKPSLPHAVFGYALTSYLDDRGSEQSTLSVDECLYAPGSPGQAFKLDENSILAYVERVSQSVGGCLAVSETAGLKQIYRRPGLSGSDVLALHYQRGNADAS